MVINQDFVSKLKTPLIYLVLVIVYNWIFSTVYLGDVGTMIELARNNEINEWQMLGGYLIGKFSLIFSDPRDGLFLINISFWVLSLTLFHEILSKYIDSSVAVFVIVLCSPLFIFSNIIYKESFPIFFFLLAFTSTGWLSPIVNSILRVNLFIESLLVYISLFYKEKKWLILISIFLSGIVFVSQLYIYNSKNGVINTVLDSYVIGIDIQTNDNVSLELKTYYQECREFEQLYNKGLILSPNLDDSNRLGEKLSQLSMEESTGLIMHMAKKAECVLVNHNRFFLIPSATYRIGSTVRDYVMIAITQLNPFFRPLVGLIFLLIPGVLPRLTRFVLVCGLFATIFMHTNPEARYFFPFILAGMINMASKLNSCILKFKTNIK
jgi:hypothetical protein